MPLTVSAPSWRNSMLESHVSYSSFLFGLLIPALSRMAPLLPSTPKAPRYTIHCACWLCLYMKKLSSACREGIRCEPFCLTCYFAIRGSNLRGKIKKKKNQQPTTSLSAACFPKAPLSLAPAPSWVRFYEPQVPGAEVSPTIFSQGMVGVGGNVLLAFLLGFVRQTHFVCVL